MFLKNITIINFKCHENLYIDFGTGNNKIKNPVRKTTFLAGENGTGKSALLQAIAMITGGSDAVRYLPGFPNNYIRHGQDEAEIATTITIAQGEERTLSLMLYRDEPLPTAIRRARQTLAPMDAALRHTARSYFAAGFGSGRRVGPAYPAPVYNARFAAVQSIFNPDAYLRPLPYWAADLLQQHGTEALDVVANAINTFLPQEVRFNSISNGQVFFNTPDGLLPLELLSNGIQQTVAWLGDLLYHISRRFNDYRNPLAARGLLLIDEIDLHMHPAWQRQLYDFLAKGLPHFQVIATTSSALTAQDAKAEELLLLQREPGGRPQILPFTSMDKSVDGEEQLAIAA